MLTKDKLTGAKAVRPPLLVEVDGFDEVVALRYPSFKEWHTAVALVNASKADTPPVETIARVIGFCLANEDGTRMMTDVEIVKFVNEADPTAVMSLYAKCWETVMKSSGAVEAAEKN